jgi:hypothetical protein
VVVSDSGAVVQPVLGVLDCLRLTQVVIATCDGESWQSRRLRLIAICRGEMCPNWSLHCEQHIH